MVLFSDGPRTNQVQKECTKSKPTAKGCGMKVWLRKGCLHSTAKSHHSHKEG
jgi:hypothetical protein